MPEAFTLTRLTCLDARLVPHDWAWARDNADPIAAHWAARKVAKPALFDGRVLLSCACTVSEGACRIDLFEVAFSEFLAFREGGSPDPAVANAFAAVVPWSRDGAVVLGVMGQETANAGQVYFPCGTPDRSDIRRHGQVDLEGSAAREFREETGLSVPLGAPSEWLLVSGEGQHAFLHPVHMPEEAAGLIARMEEHRAAQAEPELAGFVAARSRADLDADRMPGFVRAYLNTVYR